MKRKKTEEEKTHDVNTCLADARKVIVKSQELVREFYELEGEFLVSSWRDFFRARERLLSSLKQMDKRAVSDKWTKNTTNIGFYEKQPEVAEELW